MNFYPCDADCGLYVMTGFNVVSFPISEVDLFSFRTCLVLWSLDYLIEMGGFFLCKRILGDMIDLMSSLATEFVVDLGVAKLYFYSVILSEDWPLFLSSTTLFGFSSPRYF